jgi:hypothetical protein
MVGAFEVVLKQKCRQFPQPLVVRALMYGKAVFYPTDTVGELQSMVFQ